MQSVDPSSVSGKPTRGSGKAGLALTSLVVLGLLIYVGIFLLTVRDGFVGAPYGDSYDILAVEFDAQARHDPGLFLWREHAGHIIFWYRLLTSLDVRVFQGQSVVYSLAALVAVLTAVGLIAREIWRGAQDRSLAWTLAASAPLAFLTSLNAFAISAPLNTPYVLALGFAVAAFVLVERGAGLATLLGLLGLAAGAAMGNSVGLAAIPVLMIAIARLPTRGHLPIFWIAGPLLALAFLSGAGSMVADSVQSGQAPAERALRLVRYFFGFAGLPWSASSSKMALPGGISALSQLIGPTIGLLFVGVGLLLVARPSKLSTPEGRLDRLCCSLILFSLAAAGMAALGRANATPTFGIPVRYAILLAPLHVGIVVLLATRNRRLERAPPAAALAALAVIVAFALVHQVVGRHVILRYTSQLNAVIADFNAGRRTPQTEEFVYPNLARAEQMTAEIRQRGLYPDYVR